jgi:hypothetical protein
MRQASVVADGGAIWSTKSGRGQSVPAQQPI